MDGWYLPKNWYEDSLERGTHERKFLITEDKPTLTDHYRLKDLLRAVNVRLSEVEDRLHILEEAKRKKTSIPGSQENEITSSFEALGFWFKSLEKQWRSYAMKTAVETEFRPRVKIIRRRMRVLVKNASDRRNRDCF